MKAYSAYTDLCKNITRRPSHAQMLQSSYFVPLALSRNLSLWHALAGSLSRRKAIFGLSFSMNPNRNRDLSQDPRPYNLKPWNAASFTGWFHPWSFLCRISGKQKSFHTSILVKWDYETNLVRKTQKKQTRTFSFRRAALLCVLRSLLTYWILSVVFPCT